MNSKAGWFDTTIVIRSPGLMQTHIFRNKQKTLTNDQANRFIFFRHPGNGTGWLL
jgi:hypothetical protein